MCGIKTHPSIRNYRFGIRTPLLPHVWKEGGNDVCNTPGLPLRHVLCCPSRDWLSRVFRRLEKLGVHSSQKTSSPTGAAPGHPIRTYKDFGLSE
jgi:hypothetical protein